MQNLRTERANSEVEKSLPVVYSLLALSIIVWGFLFYLHRKKIACLINKDEKEKLSNLLSNLHLFLNQLHRWLKDVGYGRSPSKDRVENIRDELIIAHNRQIADVNKISTVYGKLDSELDKKAHEIATERLQPYIIYFYPYEE